MNKIRSLIILLMALVAVIGCTKDKTADSSSLSGTTWKETTYFSGNSYMDVILIFMDNGKGLARNVEDGILEAEVQFSYEYEAPNGRIWVTEETGEISTLTFTINGNKLTTTTDGFVQVLIKQ